MNREPWLAEYFLLWGFTSKLMHFSEILAICTAIPISFFLTISILKKKYLGEDK